MLPLRLGLTTYLLPRFSLPEFAEAVRGFSITDTAIVPPILTSLLHLPQDLQHHLETLRFVLCAGAPCAAAVQTQIYQILGPNAIVAQVWGSTETGWSTMFSTEKDMTGSVGRLLPEVDLKLVNDGIQVGDDLIHGEAYIRTPSAFNGYLNNLEATAASFDKDGFYKTGDRVYMHNNKLYIDGRIKDTMKIKGWQVSPTEIEEMLLQHPSIADAAVVGIDAINDDGLENTHPRAYVVAKPGSLITENQVIGFAASKLVSYKKITGGVMFVENIPRNPTGKVLRRLLHEGAEALSPTTSSHVSGLLSRSESPG